MKKIKIKKKDNIIVITGKEKGKTGEVLAVNYKTRKLLVAGLNVVKKTTKPDKYGTSGKIIYKEMPLDISNVAYFDEKTKSATKIGIKISEGKKVRFAKKSETIIKEKEIDK